MKNTYIKSKSIVSCETNDGIINENIKIIDKIGTKSVDGEVYKACYPLNCNKTIAIKKIKIKSVDKPVSDFYNYKILNGKNNIYLEILYLQMSTELVKKRICPNLPMYFKHFICNSCDSVKEPVKFCEKNCIKLSSKTSIKEPIKNSVKEPIKRKKEHNQCFYIANELASGDLKQFLHSKFSLEQLMSSYYQIFMGLYCLKKQYNLEHTDLHWGNVLYHNLENHKPSIWRYIFKSGFHLDIPIFDKVFVIWDFGRSTIPDKLVPYSFKKDSDYKNINPRTDFKRIISMLIRESHESLVLLDKQQQKNRDNLYKVLQYLLYLSKSYSDEEFLDKFIESLPVSHKYSTSMKIEHTFYPDKQFVSKNKFFNTLKTYTVKR